MKRKQIASETVQVLQQGYYQTPNDRIVNITDELQQCLTKTQFYAPDRLEKISDRILEQPPQYQQTTFSVVNETTLQGAARLSQNEAITKIGVLNFASAKNPGGGFLKGAHAQEESLARSSGLYRSLLKAPQYYEYHRQQHTCLYSDWMIYSPQCPVFRKDDGTFLEQPYCVDFITSPAPNAGAIARNSPREIAKIPATLHERSQKLLALAASYNCDALVLGAWGCGVFRNDPQRVAEIFFQHLGVGGKFWGRFQTVLFSVLDSSRGKKTYQAFCDRFS
ncbi:MAG: TIGR02452 family protein [Cyanobacteria bacterium SBLK]|nr:TIGR02452 family protein [Cyanobacteria bacterium SBLK]